MNLRPSPLSLLAASAVLLLAACGPSASTSVPTASPTPAWTPIPPGESSGPPTAPPAGSPSPSASAAGAALLLQVTTEGGFINPSASIAALPLVVVDADGRVFTPAASADGSTPTVPVLEVRDTGATGAAAILAAIRAAGLDTERSGGGVVADTGSTVFTVVIDGQTLVSRFAAGGVGPGGPGAPGATSAPGAPGDAAFALLARLTDPAETWGAPAAPVARPFVPAGYLVYVAPAGAAVPGASPWPLSVAPATFGSPAVPDRGVAGLRSGLVTGADAKALAADLATVPAGSLFVAGGTAWSVRVRPLFPDELGS